MPRIVSGGIDDDQTRSAAHTAVARRRRRATAMVTALIMGADIEPRPVRVKTQEGRLQAAFAELSCVDQMTGCQFTGFAR